MGTQVGVKGPPEQLRRMVEHLSDSVRMSSSTSTTTTTEEQYVQQLDYDHWTKDSVRRLKYRLDRKPAIQLLAKLQRRQTPQGAFDLLRALGVWDVHEDLALLRSGFPIRFTNREEQIAKDVWNRRNTNAVANTTGNSSTDPDTLLGIRQDLRHLKVYTIDGADAAEIDDGISIEIVEPSSYNGNSDSGSKENNVSTPNKSRYRIWVHIADAESYAPPHSDLFEMARRRVTSLYLPTGSIAMFPTIVGSDLMSLKVNENVRALSLGVELNDDGSLNESTIIVTPSLINVSYRLTYDEVDEMLEEGIGYNEEWEIGTLLMAAKRRREFRIRNGSSEGMIPNPVPSSSVSIYSDENEPDSIGISINIQISHNAAMNKTATAEHSIKYSIQEDPASSAYLLVTEAMIMAGEAIGVWKGVMDKSASNTDGFKNTLRLPFRTQSPPGTCMNILCDCISCDEVTNTQM
jgi:exoribonuclease R